MDEGAFRRVRGEVNRLPCVFERVLLARYAVCELAAGHHIAERETFACLQPLARAACAEFNGLLREKSAFALGLADTRRLLPHAMTLRIQCGGLNGLRDLLAPQAIAPNVHRLVRNAAERFGGLDAVPFSEVVKGIAAWKPRRRFGGGS